MNILVVEDDETMRELLADCLSSLEAKVLTAANGVEALAIIEANDIQLVVSDVQMPRMGGMELLARIRAQGADGETGKTTPIVILVTGQSQINEDSAKAAGAFALIHKPFRMQELLASVQQSLLKMKPAQG